MFTKLYNPFEEFNFNYEECFLTGAKIDAEKDMISVFPEWLMERYSLHNQAFAMLDGNKILYSEMRVPCSRAVKEQAIDPLEDEIRSAMEQGYEAVKALDEVRLFQWMAKMMYGILYCDIAHSVKMQIKNGKAFEFSPYLRTKIKNMHYMLQSLVVPMQFEGNTPWSIARVKVRYTNDFFNYKDETKNLNFSLSMNGFGIVSCLQDHGENRIFQQDLLDKIGERTLHPIQFEELWCRFLYSNYILENHSEFEFEDTSDGIIVRSIQRKEGITSFFKTWDEKVYAEVLGSYWKPWGLEMSQIYNFPNSPITFLIDEYTDELVEPESIELAY